MAKKQSFGERMKALKALKEKQRKDAELLAQFQPQPSLEAKIEQHLVMPMDPTSPVERKTVVVESLTPLERTIQRLREKAQEI